MSNVYLLYGSEKILSDQWIDQLVDKHLVEGKKDLNYSRFDMEEVPVQYVIQQAETVPFLGEVRVIVADNADFFGSATSKQNHDLERLLQFIGNPPDFSIVVFKSRVDKLDKRKKITKLLEDQKGVLLFAPLQGQKLEEWIHNRVKQYQCSITKDAMEQLVHLTSANITSLSNEIDKLCLYVGNGNITTGEIELLVPRSLEQNMFSVIDNIAQQQTEKGLQTIYDLIKNKESPILILFLLAKKFRTMLIGKELQDRGYSPQEIANQLGQHPYAIKVTIGQARMFSVKKIRRIIIRLAELDEHIKTGKMSEIVALETFILSTVRQEN